MLPLNSSVSNVRNFAMDWFFGCTKHVELYAFLTFWEKNLVEWNEYFN